MLLMCLCYVRSPVLVGLYPAGTFFGLFNSVYKNWKIRLGSERSSHTAQKLTLKRPWKLGWPWTLSDFVSGYPKRILSYLWSQAQNMLQGLHIPSGLEVLRRICRMWQEETPLGLFSVAFCHWDLDPDRRKKLDGWPVNWSWPVSYDTVMLLQCVTLHLWQ